MSSSRLLDLIGEAYAFEDLDEFRPGVLEALARAVPSDWISYNEVGADPESTISLMRPTPPEHLFPRFVQYAHENPILAAHRETRDGRPYRVSDFIDQAAFHRLALYRECYRPLGVESQVAFTLPARPPLVLAIALSRGPRDFSDEEVRLLALARPHLIQAYRRAELSTAREAALRALETRLDRLDRNVMVLDAQGRVEFATDGARRALGLKAGRVDRELREWLGVARSTPAPVPLQLPGVVVRLLPGRDSRDVVLVEPGRGALTAGALRDLGLTQREADVLLAIAVGSAPEDAAQGLGVARRTVDKHLERVYAKLGVNSRAAAIATAWAAVGVIIGS